jgi:recombination protein RecT
MAQATASEALAVRREQAEQAQASPLTKDIRRMESEFAKAMPRGEEAVQLVRDALTVLQKTPKLHQCDSPSVLGALMTCAQLGLRPSVMGEAFVLPFWDNGKGGFSAQLVIGYPGYIRLAQESQLVDSLIPRLVYAEDEFDVDYGVSDTLVHKPARGRLRGEVTDYYALAKFRSGGHAFLTMNRPEMEEHRDRFATTRAKPAKGEAKGRIFGPWVDHFDSMGMKTTIRLLAKYLPKTPRLHIARYVDGSLRLNLNPKADPADVSEPPTMDGTVVPPDDEPEGTVDGNVSLAEGQRRRIMQLADAMGHDRDGRIAYYREVAQRPSIESTNDLKMAEAAKIIRAYEAWQNQSEPA